MADPEDTGIDLVQEELERALEQPKERIATTNIDTKMLLKLLLEFINERITPNDSRERDQFVLLIAREIRKL